MKSSEFEGGLDTAEEEGNGREGKKRGPWKVMQQQLHLCTYIWNGIVRVSSSSIRTCRRWDGGWRIDSECGYGRMDLGGCGWRGKNE